MTDDDSKRVTFQFAKGKLTLQAQGADGRPIQGRAAASSTTARPIDISFNPEYLVDMLKVLPPDAELTLDLIDGDSPALFRSGANYSYLVMPLT